MDWTSRPPAIGGASWPIRRTSRPAGGSQRAVTMAQTLYVARAEAERPPRAPMILKLVGTLFAGLILVAAMWALFMALRGRH